MGMGMKMKMVLPLMMSLCAVFLMRAADSETTTTTTRVGGGGGGDSGSSENEWSCSESLKTLGACQGYVNGTEPAPPTEGCCEGVKEVLISLNTTQKRRNMCLCLKIAAMFHTIDLDKAASVPVLCHIPVPIPIYPRVDCGQIKA